MGHQPTTKSSSSNARGNKNRLCSKTCGIDNILGYKRSTKIKSPLNSKRFHPDKSHSNSFNINGRDPTLKRNMIKERQILIIVGGSHPEENYGWEIRGREQTTKVDLGLGLLSRS